MMGVDEAKRTSLSILDFYAGRPLQVNLPCLSQNLLNLNRALTACIPMFWAYEVPPCVAPPDKSDSDKGKDPKQEHAQSFHDDP